MNNVLTETNNQVGTTVTYAYDANGRRTSMQLTGTSPTPPLVTYSYDCADELVAVSNNGYSAPSCSPSTFVYPTCNNFNSVTSCLTYDLDGRRSTVDTNGVTTLYGYDANSRLVVQQFFDYNLFNWVLGSLSYQYDADGRLIDKGGSFAATRTRAPITAT
jgi:YD repeat-containing protein